MDGWTAKEIFSGRTEYGYDDLILFPGYIDEVNMWSKVPADDATFCTGDGFLLRDMRSCGSILPWLPPFSCPRIQEQLRISSDPSRYKLFIIEEIVST